MRKYLYVLLIIGLLSGLFPLGACSKDAPVTTTPTATVPATITTAATTTPSQTTTPPSTAIPLEEKAVAWVYLLVDGEYEKAVESFDAVMAAQVTAAMLEGAWNSLLAQSGECKGITDTRTVKDDQYEAVFLTCEFGDTLIDIQVTFDAAQKVAGLFFHPVNRADEYTPPAYADTALFTETGVTVGAGDWLLPGTLTMPVGEGPFPAVILVHGSGPNDRDETVEMNKPFKDLAWGLASNGIAVLRYDKRTKQYPQEAAAMLDTFTVKEEVTDDAIAAMDLLYATGKIDTGKIFVLGHSLGGMLAPSIAAADSRIAGLVILAGAARPLEDLMLEQYEYLASLDGKVDANEEAQLAAVRQLVQKIKTLDIAPGEAVLGAGKAYWEDLAGYSPAETAEGLTIPMLILQGERDYQVTMVDYQIWAEALQGRGNVTLKSYADLNHLFFTGSGKSTPDEYRQPGNVAIAVIQDIVAWVKD